MKLYCVNNYNEYNNDVYVNIVFDVFGNLYLDPTNIFNTITNKQNSSENKNFILYQINIDDKNNLFIDNYHFDHSLNNNYTDIKQLNLYNDNQLKKDINNDINYLDTNNNHLHLYEDNEYIDDCDHNYDYFCNDTDVTFEFASSKKNKYDIIIINDNNISSLYDTFIYDDKSILCFYSKAINYNSPYRINIKNNKIIFRPVGSTEKIYNVLLTYDANLVLVSN